MKKNAHKSDSRNVALTISILSCLSQINNLSSMKSLIPTYKKIAHADSNAHSKKPKLSSAQKSLTTQVDNVDKHHSLQCQAYPTTATMMNVTKTVLALFALMLGSAIAEGEFGNIVEDFIDFPEDANFWGRDLEGSLSLSAPTPQPPTPKPPTPRPPTEKPPSAAPPTPSPPSAEPPTPRLPTEAPPTVSLILNEYCASRLYCTE